MIRLSFRLNIFKSVMPATLIGAAIRTIADSHFLLAKCIPVNTADAISEKKKTPQALNSKSKAVLNIKVNPMVRSMEMTTAITALMMLGFWLSFTILYSLVRIQDLLKNLFWFFSLRFFRCFIRYSHVQYDVQGPFKIDIRFDVECDFLAVWRNDSDDV